MASRTFAVTKDVRLGTSGGTDMGAGASAALPLGVWGSFRFRAMMQFALDFSGMTAISSATLHVCTTSQVYVGFGSAPRVAGRSVTEGSWGEGTSTALTTSNSTVWPGPSTSGGVDFGGASGTAITTAEGTWDTIDITAVVQAWFAGAPNYGIKMWAVDSSGAEETSSESRTTEFRSRETSYDPYITVVYSSNSAPGTPAFSTPSNNTSVVETPGGSPAYGTSPAGWSIAFSVANPQSDITAYDLQIGTSLDANNLFSATASTAGMGGTSTKTVSTTYTGSALTRGATIYLRARFKDASGLYGPWGYRQAVVNNAALPTVGSPTTGSVARMDYVSGWASPRFVVGHIYSDPNAQTQSGFLWRVFADAAGSQGSVVFTDTKQTGVATSYTIPYTPTNGSYYWLTVETFDSMGLSRGQSTAVRTRARWARSQYHSGTLAGTPTAWSVTVSNTEPANTKVVTEYGSNSSSAAPASYTTNLGSVAFNTVFHYRVWLMAWGATPATPSHNKMTLSYSTVAAVPDDWTLTAGATIDDAEYVYGTQSLRMTYTGSQVNAYQVVPVTPSTNYVLSGRIKTVGAAGAVLKIETADGAAVLATVTATDDADWTRYSIPIWNSGSVTSVRVVCKHGGPAGTFSWFDALKMEASTVVTPWAPSVLSAGAVVDAGGVQVDARSGAGGVFRLRGSAGGSRDIVQLAANGLSFGGASQPVPVYSGAPYVLNVDGTIRAVLVAGIHLPGDGASTGALTTGSNAVLAFPTEPTGTRDNFGMHSTAATTSRLTAVAALGAGLYRLTLLLHDSAGVAASDGPERTIILVNGTEVVQSEHHVGTALLHRYADSFLLDLLVGDYVEVKVQNNTGVTRTIICDYVALEKVAD